MIVLLVLGGALLVDHFYGEWHDRLHPVVWMGRLIGVLERRAPTTGAAAQLLYGAGLALGVPMGFAGLGWVIEQVPGLDLIGGIFLLKGCLALRMLGTAGLVVAAALEAGDLEGARRGLRSLCSRDPTTLSDAELAAGATESLAENLSDSFIAPLFWYTLFGLPGAAYYRAANTLDSMVGYHGKYEWLGKVSARQDDLLNLVPARLTTGLLWLAGVSRGEDGRGGMRVWWRDRGQTESPNAGWPMAMMAGLLGVKLEKPGCYRLGDGGDADAGSIRRAWRVVERAAAGAVGLGVVAWGISWRL